LDKSFFDQVVDRKGTNSSKWMDLRTFMVPMMRFPCGSGHGL